MKHAQSRRHAVVAGSLVLATAMLAGCATNTATSTEELTLPAEDPTATIKVVSLLDLEADNMQLVVDAFEEAHPTITVEWESVPFDALASTTETRVSNKGGDPDVYWADQPRISAIAARGQALDITEAFSEFSDEFDPTAYDAGVYEDRLYGLPIANSTQLLYYNKDLLDQAGVEYPGGTVDERLTWEQVTEDAMKTVEAGAAQGLVFGQFDRYYQLEALPVSLGGSAGGTGEGNLQPDITSDAWVSAMEWYGQLFVDGVSPRGVTPETSDADFLAGKTAYMVQGPWLLPQLQESDVNWGVAPHPAFADGEAVTATGSWSLAINPFSKEQEAAAVFLKWMAIDDGAGYIKYRPNPELPANVNGKAGYFEKEVFASEEGKKAAEIIDYETANTAVNRLQTVGYLEFEEILNRAFADIRNGTDATEALQSASDELTTAWAKYKE